MIRKRSRDDKPMCTCAVCAEGVWDHVSVVFLTCGSRKHTLLHSTIQDFGQFPSHNSSVLTVCQSEYRVGPVMQRMHNLFGDKTNRVSGKVFSRNNPFNIEESFEVLARAKRILMQTARCQQQIVRLKTEIKGSFYVNFWQRKNFLFLTWVWFIFSQNRAIGCVLQAKCFKAHIIFRSLYAYFRVCPSVHEPHHRKVYFCITLRIPCNE